MLVAPKRDPLETLGLLAEPSYVASPVPPSPFLYRGAGPSLGGPSRMESEKGPRGRRFVRDLSRRFPVLLARRSRAPGGRGPYVGRRMVSKTGQERRRPRLRGARRRADEATYGRNFGAGTPGVPASNSRSARCLTLRERTKEILILSAPGNVSGRWGPATSGETRGQVPSGEPSTERRPSPRGLRPSPSEGFTAFRTRRERSLSSRAPVERIASP